ncbi:hypothetical protein [Flagellimonas myxillae]|uniref:hypothetical protein n=1 Tax=Flagellimonas myxillae TaxID=2942214 RepID=UPI00201F6C59|nr:hypothetical protein [Muricauda myxillae]MCL6266985.1 hypothetical protein [Muricauda myxillae]
MRKLSWIFIGIMLLSGCKEKNADSGDSAFEEIVFNYQKMPQRANLNPSAAELCEAWTEFGIFNSSFDVLYKARNNEDLALAIDDLIDKEKLLSESEYPGVLDALEIKSRQRVVKTYLFKVKSHILSNSETTEPTIEMINAYNSMRAQFNIVVNSQLDKKLILDEQ